MNKVELQVGELLFEFRSQHHWVNKGASWFRGLAHHGIKHYICIDSKGRILVKGKEFMRATDDNSYPVKVYKKLLDE